MTTVVYSPKHRILAADRLVGGTGGGCVKIVRNPRGDLAGAAGGMTVVQRWLRAFEQGIENGDLPSLLSQATGNEPNGEVLVIRKASGIVEFWDEDGWGSYDSAYYSIGSGSQYALGALFAGAHPKKAIEVASILDIYSGGVVDQLKL